ncbi:Uncharacterised protein [uncultured archaeon]|nr:Uncharacterised protein [uncultured archaeon]
MDKTDITKNGWDWMCYGASASRFEGLLAEIDTLEERTGIIRSVYNLPSSTHELGVNYTDGTEGVLKYPELKRLGINENERFQVTAFTNALIGDVGVFETRKGIYDGKLFKKVLHTVGHLNLLKRKALKQFFDKNDDCLIQGYVHV